MYHTVEESNRTQRLSPTPECNHASPGAVIPVSAWTGENVIQLLHWIDDLLDAEELECKHQKRSEIELQSEQLDANYDDISVISEELSENRNSSRTDPDEVEFRKRIIVPRSRSGSGQLQRDVLRFLREWRLPYDVIVLDPSHPEKQNQSDSLVLDIFVYADEWTEFQTRFGSRLRVRKDIRRRSKKN